MNRDGDVFDSYGNSLRNLKQSFQAGVDTLYNKCVSCGWTPTGKTPTHIVEAIQGIYGNRYTEGYNNGYNAGQAASGAIDLGSGTSFDVKSKYSNYRNLNVNNFAIEPDAIPDIIYPASRKHVNADIDPNLMLRKTKSYDPNSGILTASYYAYGGYGSSSISVKDYIDRTLAVHAWIVV